MTYESRALLLLCSVSLFVGKSLAAERSFQRQPPPGIPIPAETKEELRQGVTRLHGEIEDLEKSFASQPARLELVPDITIYENAVKYALEDDIFYKPEDFVAASKLLAAGRERARLLREGQSPWVTATGLVVRGYRSKLDGSVQPYGLVVPDSYHSGEGRNHRLDFWFHGRNNKLSELSFIADREKNRGEFTPADTFVLHPYGRYCNANKFAGEVDSLEALDHVQKHYPIDENRIAVRGFSMGGAATWHLAVHYASRWAAAAPGAGFVDTFIFQKMVKSTNQPPVYVQRLWHLYDAVDYAENLFNCPVVAYSGEIDGQRQAAELMSRAMAVEGLELVHIIGPKTAHKYEPRAKEDVAKRIDALMAKGRDPLPKKVRFSTWTLRYNQMAWITLDALERHWTRARVAAEVVNPERIIAVTTNVEALTFSMPAGLCPLSHEPKVVLDNQELSGPPPAADGSWTAHFQKQRGMWEPVSSIPKGSLKKRHGLQGPIDDAFMDAFVMVRPTGKSMNEKVGAWTRQRMDQAVEEWRLQFRGVARVKDDSAITDEDIANHNLILWGDPQSNKVLRRIAKSLPIGWDAHNVRLPGRTYSASGHVPVLIYPNPLNPKRYVVVNSGFTFADAAPTSNALQVPELPDYAVIELGTDKVANAGFFDEQWKLPALK